MVTAAPQNRLSARFPQAQPRKHRRIGAEMTAATTSLWTKATRVFTNNQRPIEVARAASQHSLPVRFPRRRISANNTRSSHLQRPQNRQLLGSELFGQLGEVNDVLGFCFQRIAIFDHALSLSGQDAPDELRPVLGVFLALLTGEEVNKRGRPKATPL
jgi:hypothetical protein